MLSEGLKQWCEVAFCISLLCEMYFYFDIDLA
jgi:hypothetical protein